MKFTRYPRRAARPDQPSRQRLTAHHRAVQREKDRYPLFPELVRFETAEQRIVAWDVAVATWWQQMRKHRAQSWRRARRELRQLPAGPRAATLRYFTTIQLPGDPVYLLSLIHDYRTKHRCFWHELATLRRLQLKAKKC
jgi:hypothetical protein